MSEKNILAYFKSPEEAESVSNKLKSLRVIDMSIDRFSQYPGIDMYNNTRFGGDIVSVTSMAGSVLGGQSSNILAAADTSSSGMSDAGQGGPTGRDILLTVVVDEQSFEQAMRIIEEAGGMV